MRLPRPRSIPVTIPATALADLALLLVLYFVLTTTYDADRLRLQLPASPSEAAAEIGTPCVVVARPTDPSLGGFRYRWFDGSSSTREVRDSEELWLEVSRLADRDPQATVVFKADASVAWSEVEEVLEVIHEAGVRDVLLWTRPIARAADGGLP